MQYIANIRKYKVEENSPGIYTVIGDIFPIQIIDSCRLSADENLWLKNLGNSLDPFSVIKVEEEVIRLGKAARVQAYMNAIAKANYYAVEEAMEMREPAKSLEEVLIRTGAMARAEERKALDIAQNMVNLGLSFETVVSATKLDPEKVKALYDK